MIDLFQNILNNGNPIYSGFVPDVPVLRYPLVKRTLRINMAQFLYLPDNMSIEDINRQHYYNSDMYYRVGFGLSSQLLAYRNGIIYLHVVINNKWTKNYHDTTMEMANCWKSENPELRNAIGCKVFIIDAKKYPYKEELFQMKMHVSYDAKMGMLFCDNVLS